VTVLRAADVVERAANFTATPPYLAAESAR